MVCSRFIKESELLKGTLVNPLLLQKTEKEEIARKSILTIKNYEADPKKHGGFFGVLQVVKATSQLQVSLLNCSYMFALQQQNNCANVTQLQ